MGGGLAEGGLVDAGSPGTNGARRHGPSAEEWRGTGTHGDRLQRMDPALRGTSPPEPASCRLVRRCRRGLLVARYACGQEVPSNGCKCSS